jgi:hypothetical protein
VARLKVRTIADRLVSEHQEAAGASPTDVAAVLRECLRPIK